MSPAIAPIERMIMVPNRTQPVSRVNPKHNGWLDHEVYKKKTSNLFERISSRKTLYWNRHRSCHRCWIHINSWSQRTEKCRRSIFILFYLLLIKRRKRRKEKSCVCLRFLFCCFNDHGRIIAHANLGIEDSARCALSNPEDARLITLNESRRIGIVGKEIFPVDAARTLN